MKNFLNQFIPILIMFIPTLACSTPQTFINRPIGPSKGLVIIAPAKKYLMHERLFEGLAQNFSRHGFIVVRFNWDAQTLSDPTLELQRAASDIKSVIINAQKYFKVDPRNTILISKSFSTKSIFSSISLASTHVLLTPNCSLESPFQKSYGQIIENKNIKTSIFISSEDPYCDVRQIHETLVMTRNPPVLYLSHGDHNFTLQASSSNLNSFTDIYRYQDAIIQMVTIQVLVDFYR